jgi:tetratricopeptide (TPR) repeat protein
MMHYLKAGQSPWCRVGLSFILLLFLLIGLSGCASSLDKASRSFYADQPEQALTILQKGDSFSRRSKLLFQLEQGVVLHQLGRYQESIDQFLKAAEMVRGFEKISASEQLGSLITSEWLVQYKGEYSERLWIHSYQMLNFLLLGQDDDALVEAKQALEVLGRYPDALRDDYFSRAVIALCFSQLREDNDAYLVYRQLADDLPTPQAVAADLVQSAGRLGMVDEVAHFRPYLSADIPSGDAELVLFIASDRIPKKRPGNVFLPPLIRFSFPYYAKTATPPLHVRVVSPAYPTLPPISADFAAVIRRSLDERKAQIIVKETARVAAKEALSQEVGNRQGDVAEILLRVSQLLLEEPDTRSWQTLPGRMTLVRIPLPAGNHRIRLELATPGYRQRQFLDLSEVQLRKGERVFRALRF